MLIPFLIKSLVITLKVCHKLYSLCVIFRLLNYGRTNDLQLLNATKVLEQEINWIKNVEVSTSDEID